MFFETIETKNLFFFAALDPTKIWKVSRMTLEVPVVMRTRWYSWYLTLILTYVTWRPGVTNHDHLPRSWHHLDKTMEDTQIFPTIIYHNYWIFLWIRVFLWYDSRYGRALFPTGTWTNVKICVQQIMNWIFVLNICCENENWSAALIRLWNSIVFCTSSTLPSIKK